MIWEKDRDHHQGVLDLRFKA